MINREKQEKKGKRKRSPMRRRGEDASRECSQAKDGNSGVREAPPPRKIMGAREAPPPWKRSTRKKVMETKRRKEE